MTTKTIHLATANAGKLARATQQCAKFDVEVVQAKLDLIEPQADTIAEVALAKARQAHKLLGGTEAVIAEDGGLVIPGLQGFPGPYTKYVMDKIGLDGLLQLMSKLKGHKRRAYFENVLAYIAADGTEKVFAGSHFMGEIATKIFPPAATPMWGVVWQVFIPYGFDKALSQFDADDWAQNERMNQYKFTFASFAEWYAAEAARAA